MVTRVSTVASERAAQRQYYPVRPAQQMAAACRTIAAAKSRKRHWQRRKLPHQFTFITAGEDPTADQPGAPGQLVDMPANRLTALEVA